MFRHRYVTKRIIAYYEQVAVDSADKPSKQQLVEAGAIREMLREEMGFMSPETVDWYCHVAFEEFLEINKLKEAVDRRQVEQRTLQGISRVLQDEKIAAEMKVKNAMEILRSLND